MNRLWALLLLIPGVVSAQTIGIHLGSIHIPNRDGQQDFNPGLYVKAESGITLGAYRNTMDRLSIYGGMTWDRGPFSLTAGLIYGYQHRGNEPGTRGAIGALLAPSIRLPEIAGITPRLTFAPRVYGQSSVIHLSIERTL